MQMAFTTTLPDTILKQIREYSIISGKKKNQIIEESLISYFENEKKIRMAESFKKASKDLGVIEMAEEGMDDYNKQITDLGI
jgi:hypothetical protein